MLPDPTYAAQFAAKGYCVFPLTNHNKKPNPKGWTTMPLEAVGEVFRTTTNPTGWGIQPRKDDPERLVILDVDDYTKTLDDILGMLFIMTNGEPPEGMGIVRSCSGGWHLYFRHPAEFATEEPPVKFSVAGIHGDIRSSIRGNALLVLPGSIAPSKQTKELEQYTALSGPLDDPYQLAEMPTDLWLRIRGATKTMASENPNLHSPTEIRKLREILMDNIPDDSIERGCWSNLAHSIGEIWGRIWANADSCSNDEQDSVFHMMSRKCKDDREGGMERTVFDQHFKKGWAKGRANAKKYGTENKFPGETEILAECKAIFGRVPWLQENKDLSGKRDCYILGIGDQRKKMASIENRQEVLGMIAKMVPETDMDEMTRSPLFLNSNWFNVLKVYLHTKSEENSISAAPEVELREKLLTAARDAADAAYFGETLRGGQPIHNHKPDPYSPWLFTSHGQFTLVAAPQAVKQLLMGLPPECQSYLNDFGKRKRDSYGHTWRIPLASLECSDTVAVIEARYQDHLEKKLA